MSARYISSSLIRAIQRGSRSVLVEYVDKTTHWTRPTNFPTASIKEEFAQVVEENIHTLQPNTARVALKESEHQSDKDQRMHYTGFQLDKDGNVIAVSHYVKSKYGQASSSSADEQATSSSSAWVWDEEYKNYRYWDGQQWVWQS